MRKCIEIPKEGVCLAFDFGEVRIGVAQGECSLAIATPLETIASDKNEEKFFRIGQLITEWQPKYLVVGLPRHLDGKEHDLTRLARKFGHRLNGRFKLPVFYVDERLSSVYAEELLKQTQIFGKRQKAVLDQVAAQSILQSFFESGAVEYFAG